MALPSATIEKMKAAGMGDPEHLKRLEEQIGRAGGPTWNKYASALNTGVKANPAGWTGTSTTTPAPPPATTGLATPATTTSPAANISSVSPYMALSSSTGGKVGAPSTTPTVYTPPPAYTPGPEATVEGRMPGLLASGSPYMKAAELKGLQTAHGRGLLNTSMAAEAAHKAAIEAALPIASQDAASFQAAGMEGYKGEITGALAVQSADHAQALAELQGYLSSGLSGQQALESLAANAHKAAIDSGLSAQQASEHMARIVMQGAIDSNLSAQQAQQAIALENIKQVGANTRTFAQLSSGDQQALSSQITSLSNNYSQTIANIQADPNLSAASKTRMVNNQTSIYENNIRLVNSLYGVTTAWTPADITTATQAGGTTGGTTTGGTTTGGTTTALENRITALEDLLARVQGGGGPPGAGQVAPLGGFLGSTASGPGLSGNDLGPPIG